MNEKSFLPHRRAEGWISQMMIGIDPLGRSQGLAPELVIVWRMHNVDIGFVVLPSPRSCGTSLPPSPRDSSDLALIEIVPDQLTVILV
jgi:hypothetical protein